MRRRTLVVAGTVAAVAIAATVGVLTWRDNGPDAPTTLREYPLGHRPAAPPIAGELLEGGSLDLADLRGDVVVVNVWASWCGPCRVETADLELVNQSTKELGVRFVGLNIQDERDKAISFMSGRVTYPSIFDPAFETGLGFRDPPAPIGPPATLVIDSDGNVAVAFYRQVGRTELEQAIRRVATGTPTPTAPNATATPNALATATAPNALGGLGGDLAYGFIRHFSTQDRSLVHQVGAWVHQVGSPVHQAGAAVRLVAAGGGYG
jgi:thiol-disulfide isomerase/thioredoxin